MLFKALHRDACCVCDSWFRHRRVSSHGQLDQNSSRKLRSAELWVREAAQEWLRLALFAEAEA